MATRKPKVGDPCIIDGAPAVIAIIEGDTVEMHDETRVAAIKAIEAIRALPEEEQFAAKAAFNMDPDNPRDTGTRTWASLGQMFWVGVSGVWSCFGRLLDRTPDGTLDPAGVPNSYHRSCKIHRKIGEDYDPTHEINCHIAYIAQKEA